MLCKSEMPEGIEHVEKKRRKNRKEGRTETKEEKKKGKDRREQKKEVKEERREGVKKERKEGSNYQCEKKINKTSFTKASSLVNFLNINIYE